MSDPADRGALAAEWLRLTRVALPALAADRGRPIAADHCFQRILPDHATGGRRYDAISKRPAYAHAPTATPATAVAWAARPSRAKPT